MFNIIRTDIRSARIAYVSTIAAMMIALPLWSGFLAVMLTPAAAVLPCMIPEIRPTTAIGSEAARKPSPC